MMKHTDGKLQTARRRLKFLVALLSISFFLSTVYMTRTLHLVSMPKRNADKVLTHLRSNPAQAFEGEEEEVGVEEEEDRGPGEVDWLNANLGLQPKLVNVSEPKMHIDARFPGDVTNYVINLDRRPDRWQSTFAEFSREGVPAQRFSAVDGKTIFGGLSESTPNWKAIDSIPILSRSQKDKLSRENGIQVCMYLSGLCSATLISTPPVVSDWSPVRASVPHGRAEGDP
jgi:hypothetical protein